MKSPWSWIPTLYFAQGLPYVVVMTLAVIMFKRLGINNTDIALYTSWLYLPWVIKPLWSPLVDIVKTKRWWVISMQLVIGGGLAGIALTLPGPHAFRYSLAFMWLLAFSSATHDIAADGFYMLGLDTKKQAFFVGIRNTAYRLAMLTGQGLIVMLAGWLEKTYSSTLPEEIAVPRAWSVTFYLLAVIFVLLFLYHQFILPKPKNDVPVKNGNPLNAFFQTFITFFQKNYCCLSLYSALPFCGITTCKNCLPFLTGQSRSRWLGTKYHASRHHLWRRWPYRPHDRRNPRRHLHGQEWPKTLDLVDDCRHEPAQYRVRLSGIRPPFQHLANLLRRRHRTIRLRVRFHGPHLLHDALQQRSAANRPLRHLHRIHGPRHDAPRHDLRLYPRTDRLPTFLSLDHALYHPQFYCCKIHQNMKVARFRTTFPNNIKHKHMNIPYLNTLITFYFLS